MSKILWPDQCQVELEQIFGEGTIEAPTAFARTKRGLPKFSIKLDSEHRVPMVIEVLTNAGVDPALLKNAHDNYPFDKFKGVIHLYIPKNVSASLISLIVCNGDSLKEVLQAELKKPKAVAPQNTIKKDWDAAGLYQNKFGQPAKAYPTSCPEYNAKVFHLLNRGEEVSEDLLKWLVPPQVPVGIMFCITEDGKLDIADAEQRAALIDEYEAVVQARCDMLEGEPTDRVFNTQTGEVDQLPAGTVYEKITSGDYANIGAATYWNPKMGEYYTLWSSSIDVSKKTDITAALKAQPQPKVA